MTLEELRDKVTTLKYELDHRIEGGPSAAKHVKVASQNVRKILVDLKKATPSLRRELIALDEK